MAYLNKGNVNLSSHNNKSLKEKFYPVHKALQQLNINAIVDGEIIVANEQGLSNFNAVKEIKERDELFKPVLSSGINIKLVLERMEQL